MATSSGVMDGSHQAINSGEAQLLLPGCVHRSHRYYTRIFITLIVLCILERCTYYQNMAESLDTRPEANQSTYCGLVGDNSAMLPLEESWNDQLLRSTAYLLPVLGGALADRRFGCVRVLRFSALMYVLGTLLLVLAVHVPGVFCRRDLKYVYESILAVASGFTRPCLLTLVYQAGMPLMGVTILNQLYYMGEASGQVLGSSLAFGTNFMRIPLTGVSLFTALLMLTLATIASGPERSGWQPDQFQLLNRYKLERLAVVFLPVILLTTCNVFSCFTLNARATAYFHAALNQTGTGLLSQQDFLRDSDLMLLVYSAALLVSLLALALMTRCMLHADVDGAKSLSVRIGIGLVLAGISQFMAFCIYFFMPFSSLHLYGVAPLYVIFGSLNSVTAASEGFTFSSMNELALLMSPIESRAYTAGSIYSLWGTGFIFSLSVQWISYKYGAGDDASDYFGDKARWICLSLSLLMAFAFVYFLRLAPKALSWLIGVETASRNEERAKIEAELGCGSITIETPRSRSQVRGTRLSDLLNSVDTAPI